MNAPDRTAWDRHWESLPARRRAFGAISSAVRKLILSRVVRSYADRYFRRDGLFCEAGVGSGQSAARLAATGRRLIALDFSLSALEMARREGTHRHLVCADARALPFCDGSLAGVWNLGVLEHFPPPENHRMLEEFRRVLEPGAKAIVFWPPAFGSSRLVLGPIEWVRNLGRKQAFRFFPDEINRLARRRDAREALLAAGLEPVTVDFSPRDAFIHVVVVGRRPV
jgi:SAM-dependent methyltransferase